jgi:hypothetical protein
MLPLERKNQPCCGTNITIIIDERKRTLDLKTLVTTSAEDDGNNCLSLSLSL